MDEKKAALGRIFLGNCLTDMEIEAQHGTLATQAMETQLVVRSIFDMKKRSDFVFETCLITALPAKPSRPLHRHQVDGRRDWIRTNDPHHVKVVL